MLTESKLIQLELPFVKDMSGKHIQYELVFPKHKKRTPCPQSYSEARNIINTEKSKAPLIELKSKLQSDISEKLVPGSCHSIVDNLIRAINLKLSICTQD